MKAGSQRLFESMQGSLVKKRKVNFTFKTTGIIAMYACLKMLRSRKSLRESSKSSRQVLFFLKGRDMLDKEMDISYIVKHVRILRYFLKTVLDKDQRVLLKLKSTEFVPSSEDERRPKEDERKIRHKDLILRRYVEELQKKTIGKMDFRLLEVLGFKDAIKILTEEKARQRLLEEEMTRRAKLDGGTMAGR